MAEGSRRPEWRCKESVLRLACSLERIPGTLCSTSMPKRVRALDPAKQASTNGFSRSHQDPLSYGSGEGQNVEFKRGISDDANRTGPVEDELLKSVAAFANTNDGVILIGIDDAGHVKGLALDFKQRDKLEQKIHQLIRTRLRPTPPVRVAFEEVRGLVIAKVEVGRGDSPAYMLGGTIYLRKGSADVQAHSCAILPRSLPR